MDISKLVRDPDYIKKQLTQRGDSLIAAQPMEVHLLNALRLVDLVTFGEEVEMVGSFAIICNGRYAVWSAITMYNTSPSSIGVIEINAQEHLRFGYNKGDVVIGSLNTMQTAGLVFLAIKTYIFQGKVPWFYSVGDITRLFSTAGEYAALTIDDTPELLSILEALMTRLDTDDSMLLKNSKVPTKEWHTRRRYVPMNNVAYIQSTMGKIVGNYQADGMRAALVSDPNDAGMLETISRS